MSYDYFEDGDGLNFRWLKRAWEWVREKWFELFIGSLIVGLAALLAFGAACSVRDNARRDAQLKQCESGDMAVCANCAESSEACRSHLRAYFHKEKGE